MIQLKDTDQEIILICKGQLTKEYPSMGTWVKTFKPWFELRYGWNPDEDNNYHQYMQVLFDRLFELYDLIKEDYDRGIHDTFKSAFYKGISNNAEEPIERAIHSLCGYIQGNIVRKDGVLRYSLGIEGYTE